MKILRRAWCLVVGHKKRNRTGKLAWRKFACQSTPGFQICWRCRERVW